MKQTRRILALLLALCLSWSQVSPALAAALDGEQTEPVVVVEETVAPEVVETEAPAEETEAPEVVETEAPVEETEAIETEAAAEETEVVETEAVEEEVAEEAADEEAAAGSSAENPIILDQWEWPWNDDRTVCQNNITVPAGTTWYRAYGNEMNIYVDDVLVYEPTFEQTGSTFSITNNTGAEKEVTVKCTYSVGIQGNYDKLTLGSHTAVIKEGQYMGYGYRMTVAETTEFTFTIDTSASEWSYKIWAYGTDNALNEIVCSSQASDIVDTVTFTVGAGNPLIVIVGTQLNQFTASAGTVSFELKETPKPGDSADNPIYIYDWAWNDARTEATVTVNAPVGTTWYASYGIGGMALSVNGGEATVLTGGNPRMPVTFSITNDGEAAADFELKVSYLPGHQNNPVVLTELTGGEASLAAGGAGYYYTYTAAETGTYTFYIGSITEGVTGDIIIYNTTSYVYKTLLSDGVDNYGLEVTMDVTAGDELQIQLNVQPDENWNYPAADICWVANFTYPLGSEQNPIMPVFTWNETYTEATATVTVPAGTTQYFAAYAGGMMLSINGAEAFKLVAQGMGRAPAIFTITNEGEEAAEYSLLLTYAVGSRNNPAELLLADEYNPEIVNVATVEEGSWDGYIYGWTAPEQGELTITMHKGKAGWNYSIMNMTTYAATEIHSSADEELVYSETISVNAGDEIMVSVNTCGADIYDVTPAGDVYFTAEYTMAVGIESNPIWIYNPTMPTTGAIEAGQTLYFCGYGLMGMTMTVENAAALTLNVEGTDYTADENGTITLVIPSNPMGGRMPVSFTLAAAEAAEYVISFQYAQGSSMNPAELVIGTNSAEFAEGAQEYYFSWTAEERGDLTITMAEGTVGWQYAVNNTTTWSYGDYHWSDDEIIVAETVSVNKGDVIEVKVISYDPANPWTAPAGTVSFEASFEAALGSESNPIWLRDLSDWLYEPIPANTTVYFSAYGIGGMYIQLYSDGTMSLEVAGETFSEGDHNWITTLIPSSPMGGRMPVTFAITNSSDVEQMASYRLYHPYGSMGNPAWLTIGKNTATVEENDMDGYVYQWIAEKSGYLTVTMTGKVWSYTLNNLSSYVYGENFTSDDETLVKSQTVKVNAGDEIQLIVNTPFSYETFTSPAGKIAFTATFASTQYNMLSGKSLTLKFTDPATGKAVAASKATWEITSGAEFATVNKAGKLTANKGIEVASEVVVTATVGETVNTFVVTIYPAATEVKIYNSTENMEDGTTTTEDVTGKTIYVYTNSSNFPWPNLSTVVGPENAQDKVTWTSSNNNIARFDENYGFIVMWDSKTESMKTGTVTLTATAADGSNKKASVKVVISTLIDSLNITDSKGNYVSSIGSGKSVQLKANVNATATNKKVTWEIVEGADYAKITASGKLTANKGLTTAQTVVVKATAQDAGKCEAYAYVTITPVADKVVVYTDYNVVDGKYDMNSWWPAFYLSAEVYAAGDAEGMPTASQSVTWKSSNPKIATVSEYGEVYCNKPGTVTFTATATDGSNKKATVKVTIVKSISYIEMQSEAIIAGGKTLTLKPTINDADATNKKLNWTMTMEDGSAVDKSVATLSKTGKLTTKKTDKVVKLVVTCTATDGSYASASCTVTIYPATTKVTIMHRGEAVKGTQTMTVGQEKIFYADFLPETAAGQFQWKSSNEKIAQIEVNSDGSVTVIAVGEKTGTVTITAAATDGSGKKATMKIKVTPAV